MSHIIHHTDALVLGAYPSGESNRMVLLLTKELGYIPAVATGVRKETSKLRFSLQPYMYSRVALVQGREVWRLTGAHAQKNLHRVLEDKDAEREFVMRLVALLRRLLHGEGRNETLYELVHDALKRLENSEFSDEELEAFECIVVLHVLSALGYEPQLEDHELVPFMIEDLFDESLVERALPHRRSLISHINTSLAASQL